MLERLPIDRKRLGRSIPNPTIRAANTMRIAYRWSPTRHSAEGADRSARCSSCRCLVDWSWRAHLLSSLVCRNAAALIASSVSSSPASVAVCRPWVMTITRSQTSASSPNSVVTHSTAM